MKSTYVIQKGEKTRLISVTAGLLDLASLTSDADLPGTVVVSVTVLDEHLAVTKERVKAVASCMWKMGDPWLKKLADLIMAADYIRLQRIINAFPEEWEQFKAILEAEEMKEVEKIGVTLSKAPGTTVAPWCIDPERDTCVGCGRCSQVCLAGINPPDVIRDLQAEETL